MDLHDDSYKNLKNIADQILKKVDEIKTSLSQFKENELQLFPLRVHSDFSKISTGIMSLQIEIEALVRDKLPLMEKESVSVTEKLVVVRHKMRMLIGIVKGYSEMIMEDLPSEHAADSQLPHILGKCKQIISLIDELRENKESLADEKEFLSSLNDLHPVQEKYENITSILIVDDNEQNCELLNHWLQRKHYQTFVARSGKQALALLEQHPDTDLILLDMMMPIMDGYEVLLRIKNDERFVNTMVIMLSGVDEMDSVVRCIMSGAEDYLIKPFNPYILGARIYACSEKKRLRQLEEAYWDYLALLPYIVESAK